MGDINLDWTEPFTIADAYRAGFDRAQVRTALRRGIWIRLRHGVFVTARARAAAAADPATLHAQDVRALMLATSRRRLVAAENSAARIYGLEFLDPPGPELIVLTDDPGVAGTHRDGYFLRSAQLPDADVCTRHGVPITSAARTVVDIAANRGFVAGVVAAESALRLGRVTKAELLAALESAAGRPGVEIARAAITFADGRTASVLESVSRTSMKAGGIVQAHPQWVVWISGQMFIVDFCWTHLGFLVFGEADGTEKYVSDGDRLGTIRKIRAEKEREELLRAEGEVVRWGWREAREPALLAARLNAGFVRAAERQRGRAG